MMNLLGHRLNLDLWVKVLLFLFPIGLVSVRHWASGFFIALCLTGIVVMAKRGKDYWRLSSYEWIFITLTVLFFGSFLLTSLVNGWDAHATRALGTEIRFLFIIPLYLLVRQIPDAAKFVALGCVFAIFINLALVVYEIHVLGIARSNGIYGPLFVGPVTVLLAAVVLHMVQFKSPARRWLFRVVILVATIIVAAYSSRSALLGVIVLVLYLLITQIKQYRWLIALVLGVGVVLGVQFHATTKARVLAAYNDVAAYIEHEAGSSGMAANPRGNTSAGVRLEMGKAALYILKEKPIFGAGRYLYTDFVKKYVDQGLLNSAVVVHGHPHSMLLAAIFFKGLLGLLLVLAIFIYMLWFFAYQRKQFVISSYVGMGFMISVFVVQMTESAVLIKGNFIAVFLVILSVLFAYKVQEMERAK